MNEYRLAAPADFAALWEYNIAANADDARWPRWREQFAADIARGAAATLAAVVDGVPIGEVTLLFSPDCRAVAERTCLADGRTVANLNALRVRPAFEGQGHASGLIRAAADIARGARVPRADDRRRGARDAQSRDLSPLWLHVVRPRRGGGGRADPLLPPQPRKRAPRLTKPPHARIMIMENYLESGAVP